MNPTGGSSANGIVTLSEDQAPLIQ